MVSNSMFNNFKHFFNTVSYFAKHMILKYSLTYILGGYFIFSYHIVLLFGSYIIVIVFVLPFIVDFVN